MQRIAHMRIRTLLNIAHSNVLLPRYPQRSEESSRWNGVRGRMLWPYCVSIMRYNPWWRIVQFTVPRHRGTYAAYRRAMARSFQVSLSCQRRKDQTNALQKQVGAAHDDHKYGNVDGISERWTWETISPRIGHVKRSYSVV